MSYFDRNEIPSSGENKYGVEVGVSDKHGHIRSFYFNVCGDDKDEAMKTVKDRVKNSAYLGGDHLDLDFRLMNGVI